MFGRKEHKRTLERLRGKLRQWEGAVPPSAERFHRLRRDLLRRIEARLARGWRGYGGDDEIERFADRVERLEVLAGRLGDLIGRAQALEAEARKLQERRTARDAPDFDAWLEERTRRWAIELQQVGANCDRPPLLMHDEAVLNRVEGEIRLHAEAVRWYREARGVLDTLGADLETAKLEGALPDLARRLYDGAASDTWIDELKALVQPLQKLAAQPQPDELSSLPSTLNDLRGWVRELGVFGDELHRLNRRHSQVALEWRNLDPAEIQELVDEAEALRQQLIGRGEKIREEMRQGLENQVLDLFKICGPDPGLEERLRTLPADRLKRHQKHHEWMREFTTAREEFKSIAQTHTITLEERRDRRVDTLRTGLKELRRNPLSKVVAAGLNGLQHDVERLAEVSQAENLLPRLRDSEDFEDRLEQLKRDALRAKQEVQLKHDELRARNERMQEAIGIAGSVPDLSERLQRLAEELEAGGDLETTQELTLSLEHEVDEVERQFVASARRRLAEDAKEFDAALAALQRAGDGEPMRAAPEIAADADPAAATEALDRARELVLAAGERVKIQIRRYENRGKEILAKLRQVPEDALGPRDRYEAGELDRDLKEGSWIAPSSIASLAALVELIERCDLFFARLEREWTAAEERLERLRRRLDDFEKADLKRFSPRLTDRVGALVFGLKEGAPHRLKVYRRQLAAAEEAFGKLESQARRLAARELEQAIGALEIRRSSGDAGAARAGELLALIADHGHETLPPIGLRLQLLEEVR